MGLEIALLVVQYFTKPHTILICVYDFAVTGGQHQLVPAEVHAEAEKYAKVCLMLSACVVK